MSSENVRQTTMKIKHQAHHEGAILVNTSYLPRYRKLLAERLPEDMKDFAAFFTNLNRLRTLSSMLEKHVGHRSKTILNAGCGPFAAEIFSASFQNRQINSFDYTKGFADLYPVLQGEGQLPTTTFVQGDANTIVYPSSHFDVIVFHDIFYETALSVPQIISRFNAFLKPGGHIYLDYMNQSTALLWRILGRERRYKRYTSSQIFRTLEENGFEILEIRRSSGTNSRAVKFFNMLLWTVFRTSNAFGLVARKRTSREP